MSAQNRLKLAKVKGNQKGQTKWDKPSRIRSFSQIFADFCRFHFSWELQQFGGADFRRKPQETTDFRRNRFVPFSLSLLIPPYKDRLTLARQGGFRFTVEATHKDWKARSAQNFSNLSGAFRTLASRKHCDLKTRKRCDFYSAPQKIAVILSALFWRCFCNFCRKTCDFALLDLKTQRFFCDCYFWDAKFRTCLLELKRCSSAESPFREELLSS